MYIKNAISFESFTQTHFTQSTERNSVRSHFFAATFFEHCALHIFAYLGIYIFPPVANSFGKRYVNVESNSQRGKKTVLLCIFLITARGSMLINS